MNLSSASNFFVYYHSKHLNGSVYEYAYEFNLVLSKCFSLSLKANEIVITDRSFSLKSFKPSELECSLEVTAATIHAKNAQRKKWEVISSNFKMLFIAVGAASKNHFKKSRYFQIQTSFKDSTDDPPSLELDKNNKLIAEWMDRQMNGSKNKMSAIGGPICIRGHPSFYAAFLFECHALKFPTSNLKIH
ncbi:hypothetical protein EGR_03954 [Echinococcus granulosus]|uniref:Uncharacterized protein n=1 Tax=Echinococcus granulosus TaxID=6210 RepID=W6V4Y7_ECHGR|nr:hypothetical protein EGR_03954 [Echinococcus granulosus]EUB61279.1 hypothetical protein EGR_03954 [Echinococcus granulosus]